jgi:hypothetical protein
MAIKEYRIEYYDDFTKLQRSDKGDRIMDSVPHLRSGNIFFIEDLGFHPRLYCVATL